MALVEPLRRIRHTRRFPCPICGGGDDDPRGRGVRCDGFTSGDGRYAHCAREEHAGALTADRNGRTYAHRLDGPCACGMEHGGGASAPRREPRPPRTWPAREYLPATTRVGDMSYPRTREYEYRRADRALAYLVARYEAPGPVPPGEKRDKTFFVYSHRDDGTWVNKLEGGHLLYQLDRLADAPLDTPIIVCEGEKAAEAAQSALDAAGRAVIVTTVSGSTGGARYADLTPLRGRRVVILPDADQRGPGRPDEAAAGERYAATIAQRAREAGAAAVLTLALDGLPDHGDVVEWLAVAGHDGAELARLAEAALAAPVSDEAPQIDTPSAASGPSEGDGRGPSVATQLVALALADEGGADLWHDADGDAWATYPISAHDGVPAHRETCRLSERGLRRWLAARMYTTTRRQPPPQAFQEALLTLEGVAVNERPRRMVATRLASDPADANVIYLDLADEAWRVVRITVDGWTVMTQQQADALSIRFRRSGGMEPLPMPTRGGSVGALRQFINVADDANWRLVVAALVAALRPTGPYPVLSLTGEQGAAKTTTARMIRALVDPNRAAMRRAPRDERDLMIAAKNSWVVTLDNLSSLPAWLSDALCVVSTGGGLATRALYENDAEMIFAAQRPIILTGIEEAATRGDLVDRALLITLEAIPDERRMTEAALWRAFEAARPRILGALLDVVAGALRDLPDVRLEGRPRMADFAEWATAAETALGWERGEFMAAYTANRAGANEIALDASPVAGAIIALLDDTSAAPDGRWSGTSGALLEALTRGVSDLVAASPTWPKSARGLSGALMRLRPNLRRAGISIDRDRTGHGRARTIFLTRAPQPGAPPPADRTADERVRAQPSAPSAPSATAPAAVANAELFSGEHDDGMRTVARTVALPNHPHDTQPSAYRPQADRRIQADSQGIADGADGADGWPHPSDMTSTPSSVRDNRARGLSLAQALDWPPAQVAPHLNIPGERAWRSVLSPNAPSADVTAALAWLTAHIKAAAGGGIDVH